MNIAPLAERSDHFADIRELRCALVNHSHTFSPDYIHALQIDLAVTIYCLFHGGTIRDGYNAHGQGFIPQWIYDLAR